MKKSKRKRREETLSKGQSVMIGDEIEVKVLDVKDGKVSLGVAKPENILVLNKENLGASLN